MTPQISQGPEATIYPYDPNPALLFRNLETEYVKMIQNMKTLPTGMGSAPTDKPSKSETVESFDFNEIPGEIGQLEEEDEDDLC